MNNNHLQTTKRTLGALQLSMLAAAALVATSQATAAVGFDANIEVDSTWKSSRDQPTAIKSDTSAGGRVEINANAALAKSDDYFANAKGTLILPLAGDKVTIDDAWIQFGNKVADVKLGRMEAVDLFPLGKDTIVETVGIASGYRANLLRGRVTDGRLHGILGFNGGSDLRLELGVVTKKNDTTTSYGLRPTVSYNLGPVALRAGFESFKTPTSTAGTSTTSASGFGLSAGYSFAGDSNLNANYAKSSKLDSDSIGLNAIFGGLGVGVVRDSTGDAKQNTAYAAYTMPLFGIKGATITPAISHSTGSSPNQKIDSLTAARLRFNYAF